MKSGFTIGCQIKARKDSFLNKSFLVTLSLVSLFGLHSAGTSSGQASAKPAGKSDILPDAKKIWEILITTDPVTNKATPEVKKLMGKPVEVMGYMIINESEDGEISEFLLTRIAGGCIHVPPPPPNSIIHVKMTSGKTAKYYTGEITVKGKIQLGGRMDAIYEMTADAVEKVPAT